MLTAKDAEEMRARRERIKGHLKVLKGDNSAEAVEARELGKKTIRDIDAALAEYDNAMTRAFDTRGVTGASTGGEDLRRATVLRSGQSFSDYMRENYSRLRSEQTGEERIGQWPKQWDAESTSKYWKGMCTGNWHNAQAEQRAAMAEGTTSTGGYLVPSPVAGQYVDLLRDAVVFMQGQSNVVPWNGPGKTMVIPVTVTDVAIQNLAEGVESYPPPSDVTVGQYVLTARPYSAVETWSYELEEDSQIPVPDIVQRSFAQRMARSVQSDFLYGTGATNINGIDTASGLLSGFEGGASPPIAPASAAGYDAWDKAIQAVRTAKSDVDMIVTSPLAYQTYGRLKNTLNDALRPSPTVASYLNGQGGPNGNGRCHLTTAIKDNRTVGTDTSDVSDVFFLWSNFIYWGIKHDMSVLPLRERFATTRQNGALAWLRVDAVLAHAEAAYRLQVKTS